MTMTQRPSLQMLSRPLATRIGAPLIALLTTITGLTGSAAVTVTIGAPDWVLGSWSVKEASSGIGIALWLSARPHRTAQPPHARMIAGSLVAGAVAVSLAALMVATSKSDGGWVLIAATAVEATCVLAVSAWVAAHRQS